MKYSVNKSAHVFAVAERKIRDQREKQRACGYFYMVRLTEPLYETFHVYTPPEKCILHCFLSIISLAKLLVNIARGY